MADDMSNTMNLDLNLGPIDHSSEESAPGPGLIPEAAMNLEDWLDGPVNRFREVVRQRRRWRSVWRHMSMPPEARNMALELIGGTELEDGEGSIATEEIPEDTSKVCENKNGFSNDDVLGKKDDDEKGNGDAGSFFDCNICLDLSKDPVVTCCGHLFCWPCLYRWLHIHSDAKECPVCKGEVTTKNLTPIYGRGKKAGNLEDDLSLKIPLRPQARRIESLRQAIQRPTQFSMDEMIRLLNGRFDISQGPTPAANVDAAPQESPDRITSLPSHWPSLLQSASRLRREQNNNQAPSLLNQFLAARGLRREQSTAMAPEDAVNLTESSPTNSEVGESRRVSSSVFLRRSNSSQAANISHLTSALSSAERLVESYFRNHQVERTQEQAVPVDDRDSISSIAAVIHSESQTVDTAVEIDSTVSHSTSSSRRRHEASRVSDVDSGDSRAPRRRRLA